MKFPKLSNILKTAKKEEYSKYLVFVPNFKAEKTQKFTTIVLTLTASMVLLIFAVNPTLSTISNLQKQLEDNRFVERQLEQKINNLSVLQQKYSEVQQDLPIVYDAVPKDPRVVTLVSEVQGIAQDSGLILTNFQTFEIETSQKSIAGKKYSSYDFTASAEGSYENMKRFLDNLIGFQRIITINNMSITRQQTFGSSILQLSVKGTAYFKN
jgi:Tfp pilus assembly protein PilO